MLGCASDEGVWTTYQAAGEAASLHARYDKADGLLLRALEESAERPAERVRSQVALARVARERDDLAAARAWLAEARAGAGPLPPDAPETLRLELEEAWLRLDEGAAEDAAERFAQVERRALRIGGEHASSAGWAAAGRGEALRRTGDRSGARASLDVALDRFTSESTADSIRPGEPLGALAVLTSLGALLRSEGDLEGARGALKSAAIVGARELGTDHPRVAAALAELALVELARGEREGAVRAATRAADIARGRLPEGHPTRRAAEDALAAVAAP